MTALTSTLLSSTAVLEESLQSVQLPDDFDDVAIACGVSEDALPEVRIRSIRIIGHRRRDAAETFGFGDDLVFVQGQMRDEEVFADFATETFGYDAKYIGKFMRVSTELAPDRYRCISLAMKSTQLIEMLPRTPKERDEILTKLEQGQKVTAAQIKSWGKEETSVDPLVQSGRKGLMALGQSNLKTGVSSFTMLIGRILARIQAELEPENGRKPKAIQKGKLNADVRHDARTALGHLVRLACGLTADAFGDTKAVDLPDGSGWRKVKDIIYVLGRAEGEWPNRGELRSWLTDEAVPALRWALSAISGTREGAVSVVLSLGLGLSVLAAMGQIDGNLRNAISGELPDIAPSYFFVDIQKDQMPGFRARLGDDPAVSKVQSAPMLRGIITRINGQPAREVAGDHWVIRGDRGVTYSAALPEDTTLTAGTWWEPDYAGPPLVSFAAEEAAEIGLHLGDDITVNILGRDITATIASFREVDFSTAGIGFVMSMNPAALEAAPHSFISTVYAEEAAEATILRDLTSTYPNITAIRVRDAVDRVAEIMGGIAQATAWGAAATLLTGFLVLIGAAAAGEQARTYEAAVLKTLGAARARILQSFALRAALLGAAAGLVALGAGVAGGWAVMTYLMEVDFAVQWSSALLIVLGGVLATLLASLGFAWRPLAARPARVLRARE